MHFELNYLDVKFLIQKCCQGLHLPNINDVPLEKSIVNVLKSIRLRATQLQLGVGFWVSLKIMKTVLTNKQTKTAMPKDWMRLSRSFLENKTQT